MTQVDESALQDPSQFTLTVSSVRHTEDYSKYKFKLTCVANNQIRAVGSSLTSDEIAALPLQTDKARLDASYAKILNTLRTIAYELSQESSYIGQNYYTTT